MVDIFGLRSSFIEKLSEELLEELHNEVHKNILDKCNTISLLDSNLRISSDAHSRIMVETWDYIEEHFNDHVSSEVLSSFLFGVTIDDLIED